MYAARLLESFTAVVMATVTALILRILIDSHPFLVAAMIDGL